MKKLYPAVLCAMVLSAPAFACQPPFDMPHDPAKAAEYWEQLRLGIEKQVFNKAATILVARVVAAGTPDTGNDSGMIVISATFAPIKTLRGSAPAPRTGKIEYHWCADYKPYVTVGKVYLLAMSGTEIRGAVDLDEGKERTGVATFYERIAEPNPWK
jgi:hypothetical protein